MIAEVKDLISLAEKTCAIMGAGRARDPAVVGCSSKDYGAAVGCAQSPTYKIILDRVRYFEHIYTY
jgi:hypothetical protein